MMHEQPNENNGSVRPSELAWVLADYEAAGIEAPGRCVSNPELSEGEMMSADEVEEYVKDSIAVLRILSDKQSPRLEAVRDVFKADMLHLMEVGQISEDDYNGLTSDANLTF